MKSLSSATIITHTIYITIRIHIIYIFLHVSELYSMKENSTMQDVRCCI